MCGKHGVQHFAAVTMTKILFNDLHSRKGIKHREFQTKLDIAEPYSRTARGTGSFSVFCFSAIFKVPQRNHSVVIFQVDEYELIDEKQPQESKH